MWVSPTGPLGPTRWVPHQSRSRLGLAPQLLSTQELRLSQSWRFHSFPPLCPRTGPVTRSSGQRDPGQVCGSLWEALQEETASLLPPVKVWTQCQHCERGVDSTWPQRCCRVTDPLSPEATCSPLVLRGDTFHYSLSQGYRLPGTSGPRPPLGICWVLAAAQHPFRFLLVTASTSHLGN